ncbi:hypothetical protein A2165_00730 [Candidatus Curtissbacteria bacterium RBG_13_40_7]|uniref:Lipoprotein n=1 Tax=Candidatus Curtissbacteria bacterium RBG_13_40_7 TaxID=1797706 RepID=A0A1F5FUI1_9BACT|nr:MAG: hypothetical protein A2165_00730 [Candidatus Curtissbacteria bacterium RBG_13_40_7]
MVRLILILAISIILSACVPSIGGGGGVSSSDEYMKGRIVKGFPGLPAYPKAEVIESYGNEGSYGASFMSSDDLAKVVKFYNDSIPQIGWEMQAKKQSETNFSFDVKNAQYQGSVIVNTAADGKKTAITIFASPR